MKKIFFTFLLLSAVAVSAVAQGVCTIDGAVVLGDKDAEYSIVIATGDFASGSTKTDVIPVVGGKFSYSIPLTEPCFAQLVIPDGNEVIATNVVLVPDETMEVIVNNKKVDISGSSFYRKMKETRTVILEQSSLLADFMNEYRNAASDAERQEIEAMVTGIMKENPSENFLKENNYDPAAIIAALMTLNRTEVYTNYATDDVKNGEFKPVITFLLDMLNARKEAQERAEQAAQQASMRAKEGSHFVDFEAEYDGKTQKLSDYVGRGKYVLVDFWASWCGPCKREIPNIKAVYEKYKGDRFDVLGVATWDKPEDTLSAIDALEIPYPQMLNAQRAGSDAYGITGIPQIILFSPDGTILRRDLRGDDIEAAVAKCLNGE